MFISFNASAQVKIGNVINGEAAADQAGYSVSMGDAKTVAIGAYQNSDVGSGAGSVRVYSLVGTSWIQKGTDIDAEAAGDNSGKSVSMADANTLAIGAPGNDGGGNSSGHVRVYRWNGTSWIQKGADINGEAAGDESGGSVIGGAVSMPDSNTVAIGAPGNSGTGLWAGHVRVYRWNGTAWIQKGSDIDGQAAGDGSGVSVSMPDANTVAIGAHGHNVGVNHDNGQVRVYSWNGASWIQKGTEIDGENAHDFLGFSVSMPDSNTVAIGAPKNDGVGGLNTNAGQVQIYSWNGTSWTQKGANIYGEEGDALSGTAVSMPDSNTVAIGSPGFSLATLLKGLVQVYGWDGTNWVQKCSDIYGVELQDMAGSSVSMPDAKTLAVGGPGQFSGTTLGKVWVYDLTCCTAASTSTLTATACSSYTLNAQTYTSSGTYTQTIPNTAGCDSTITLNLTITAATASSITATACSSYTLNAQAYTSSGTYTQILTNAASCDSILTLNLTITTVNAFVSQSGNSLTATTTGASYQWINCNGNTAITGATNQVYTATANGSYAVIVTKNGCSDTSSCVNLTGVGIAPLYTVEGLGLRCFPNPTNGQVNLLFANKINNGTIKLMTLMGQTVIEKTNLTGDVFSFDISGYANGIYLVEIKEAGNISRIKLVKN